MFSLSQSDELVFQIHYPFPEQQQEGTIIQQDLVTDQASTVPTNLNNLKRHRNKSSLSTGDDIKDESTGNGNKQKKVMHREIERGDAQRNRKVNDTNLSPFDPLKKLATQGERLRPISTHTKLHLQPMWDYSLRSSMKFASIHPPCKADVVGSSTQLWWLHPHLPSYLPSILIRPLNNPFHRLQV